MFWSKKKDNTSDLSRLLEFCKEQNVKIEFNGINDENYGTIKIFKKYDIIPCYTTIKDEELKIMLNGDIYDEVSKVVYLMDKKYDGFKVGVFNG